MFLQDMVLHLKLNGMTKIASVPHKTTHDLMRLHAGLHKMCANFQTFQDSVIRTLGEKEH